MVSFASSLCPQCGHPIPEHAAEGLCAACLLGGALEVERTHSPLKAERGGTPELTTIGDYRILERLGQGGMGLVFKAEYPGEAEAVAIKTIAAGDLAAPQDVRRFRLEAEAIARLEHPHIVPVYFVGEDRGRHYFVMMLAKGGSLADLPTKGKNEAGGAVVPARQAAALVVKIARGVHYAHQRGILHRDLKPANILLDGEGEPMVADFGLAKLLEGGTQLTLAGAALGTPSYMAPEQAGGAAEEVTIAADLYSLGAILYFLLTGEPPFTAPTALELLKRIGTELPLSPRRLVPEIDRDLALICLKCLEKNPGGRYATAEALAADLEQWLRGEPIAARPATALERVRGWARRRPVLAATSLLGAVAVLTLAAVLAAATVLLQQEKEVALEHERSARRMAARAGGEARRAEASRVRTRLNLYAADMYLTGQAIEEGNLGLARTSLRRHVPEPGEEDLRGFEWYAYGQLSAGDERLNLEGHEAAVTAVALDPTGKTVASVSRDETVRFWSVQDGRLLHDLPGVNAPTRAAEVLLFPRLIARSPEAVDHLLSRQGTFDEIRMRGRPSRLGEITTMAWSNRGDLLATGSMGAFVRLWDAREGTLQGILPITFSAALAFTPDDSRLVVAIRQFENEPGEIRIYDTGSLRRVRTVKNARPCFALSSDGSKIAVAPGPREVEMQELESGRALGRWQTPEVVDGLSLSPDGRLLATLEDAGRKLGFFAVGTGRELGRVVLAPVRLTALSFSPDGETLVGAGSDHAIHLYDTNTFAERELLRGHEDEVLSLSRISEEGVFASGGNDHSVRLWALDSASSPSGVVALEGTPVDLSSDGMRVLLAHQEETICGSLNGEPASSLENRRPLGFIEAGSRYLTLRKGERGEPVIEVHSIHEERIEAERRIPGAGTDWFLGGAHLSSGRILLGTKRAGVRIYASSSLEPLCLLEHSENLDLARFEFSADGSRIACLRWPRGLTVWDGESGRRLNSWSGSDGTIAAFCLSPDGRLLASGGDDNLISIWETMRGERLATLRGHKDEVKGLAFSPDGRSLASTSRDLVLRLWHVPTWRDLGILRRGEFYHWLGFTPDGSALVAKGFGPRMRRISGPPSR